MGRVSRNPCWCRILSEYGVTPRMGRVSRNIPDIGEIWISDVTPRMGRVSRNPAVRLLKSPLSSRPAWGV